MRFVLILALAACGSSQDLTCALLADPNNCWAQASLAMAACVPARATPATLAADRGSCTFTDGVVVTFDAPLPTSLLDFHGVSFTVTANGAMCGRFVDQGMNKLDLSAGAQSATAQLHPDHTFELACGNGTSYAADFDLLFTCQAPARAPTDGFDVPTQTSFTFSLSSVSTPGTLFTCQ
jgi:hypothetical protein